MIYSDVITLIAESTSQDEDGYQIATETATEIYADVKSVKRTEFYDALRSGITETAVFTIFIHDYDKQRLIDYNGIRYKVERVYQTGLDRAELTCSEVRRL